MNQSRQSSRDAAIWTLDPHTAAKHQLLRGYLGAWFPILAKFKRRLVYLDGFAGPGVYADGEPGSPLIALRSLLDHRHLNQMGNTEFVFVFNEQDKIRYSSLVEVLERERRSRGGWPANVTVQVQNQNFTTLAEDMLRDLGDDNLAPTFAFLDPFGYRDIPIDLIAKLMNFKRIELFVYFDFNSVMRFATAGIVDPHLSALFGTDEYKDAPMAGDTNRKPFIRDLYQRQLESVCGFQYVRSFEMINSGGKTGNYLYFCTRNLLGLDQMKSVMWSVDPLGNFRFSDVLAGQDVLFVEDVDVSPLRQALADKFAGEIVTMPVLDDYVTAETPYVKAHLRTRTLKPMQAEGLISVHNQKRKGTFPEGTRVEFPASYQPGFR